KRREECREDRDCQQKIGNRPGQDDQKSLPPGPELERSFPYAWWRGLDLTRLAGGIHVADKLYIAAQRQPPRLPAGIPLVGPAGNFAPETDRELFGADAKQAR